MDEVMRHGRRLRAQAHPLPEGGFAAKIMISPLGQRGSWHLSILRGQWSNAREAEAEAILTGQQVVIVGWSDDGGSHAPVSTQSVPTPFPSRGAHGRGGRVLRSVTRQKHS